MYVVFVANLGTLTLTTLYCNSFFEKNTHEIFRMRCSQMGISKTV